MDSSDAPEWKSIERKITANDTFRIKLNCIVLICLLIFSYTIEHTSMYIQAICVKRVMVWLVTNVQNVKWENSNPWSEGKPAHNALEI